MSIQGTLKKNAFQGSETLKVLYKSFNKVSYFQRDETKNYLIGSLVVSGSKTLDLSYYVQFVLIVFISVSTVLRMNQTIFLMMEMEGLLVED